VAQVALTVASGTVVAGVIGTVVAVPLGSGNLDGLDGTQGPPVTDAERPVTDGERSALHTWSLADSPVGEHQRHWMSRASEGNFP
jgi:hypothetical protein